ncbi:uncharacterized protein EDB93DRAFT_1100269 [Suillus bovinus]|uniref:uncharacterized protein n=1 Tax=Suillus bovinus TaxID=48563 RepID=UPI001B864957|nr:uncharacterized protein EDB93DRAFT_1100269 [Suillus bovinus]KAG2158609.1 hypothetical protein EDB93DRAFT_1100269 [Suillus bovinus]
MSAKNAARVGQPISLFPHAVGTLSGQFGDKVLRELCARSSVKNHYDAQNVRKPSTAHCQKVDWKVHKRSVCTKPAILHKVDKMMKKWGGPGSAIDNVKRRRRNPIPAHNCDGCLLRFRGTPPEDEYDVEDVGDAFKRCTTCDYTICEICTYSDMQGVPYFYRPPGTCRCLKSNFGESYCLSSPCYLHGDGSKPYHGDRHPDMASSGYGEDAFEAKKRQCRTCGVIARCLKKEHLKDAVAL